MFVYGEYSYRTKWIKDGCAAFVRYVRCPSHGEADIMIGKIEQNRHVSKHDIAKGLGTHQGIVWDHLKKRNPMFGCHMS